jgi:phosphatidylglycerol lysyltransferase
MDALFTYSMLWARDQGYQWFNLGMAPLSGLPPSPMRRTWARFGQFVYRHGEAFYNFRGLRAYKEKFNPEWESRYLVYSGGLTLPRALTDIVAVIAGGYTRIFLPGNRRTA